MTTVLGRKCFDSPVHLDVVMLGVNYRKLDIHKYSMTEFNTEFTGNYVKDKRDAQPTLVPHLIPPFLFSDFPTIETCLPILFVSLPWQIILILATVLQLRTRLLSPNASRQSLRAHWHSVLRKPEGVSEVELSLEKTLYFPLVLCPLIKSVQMHSKGLAEQTGRSACTGLLLMLLPCLEGCHWHGAKYSGKFIFRLQTSRWFQG